MCEKDHVNFINYNSTGFKNFVKFKKEMKATFNFLSQKDKMK